MKTKTKKTNFITILCFDTVENKYVIKTLDLREPIDRYIPECSMMSATIN